MKVIAEILRVFWWVAGIAIVIFIMIPRKKHNPREVGTYLQYGDSVYVMKIDSVYYEPEEKEPPPDYRN